MTYQEVKNKVVEENNWVTAKELKWIYIKMLIITICVGGTLAMTVGLLLNYRVALLVFALLAIFYTQVFGIMVDTLEELVVAKKVLNICWVTPLFPIIVNLILWYFRFI